MSNDLTNEQNDKSLEYEGYIEHRMMFLGHTLIKDSKDIEDKDIKDKKKEEVKFEVKFKNFSFNDYSNCCDKIEVTDPALRSIIELLYNIKNDDFKKLSNKEEYLKDECNAIIQCKFSYNNKKGEIYNKETYYTDLEKSIKKDINQTEDNNNDNKIKCKEIIYNFLNNGCVSIVIHFKHNSEQFKNDYEEIAGNRFDFINKLLLIRINDIIYKLKNCLNLGKFTLCGIPTKLIKNSKDLFITDSMVYSQHFIDKKVKYDTLKFYWRGYRQNFTIYKENKKVEYEPIEIGWGYRKWKKNKDNKKNKENEFLDSEFLFLSRQVLVNSQILVSTEISKQILMDKQSTNIQIEDLELLICSYKTFHQINDLMLMDFDENARDLNNRFFKDDDFKELVDSKDNSEEAVIKILKSLETKRNKKINGFVQFILIIIGSLTLYSVTHDLVQFVDIKIPKNFKVIEEEHVENRLDSTIQKEENTEKSFPKTIIEKQIIDGIEIEIKKTIIDVKKEKKNTLITETVVEHNVDSLNSANKKKLSIIKYLTLLILISIFLYYLFIYKNRIVRFISRICNL